jgi:hypothetical protein
MGITGLAFVLMFLNILPYSSDCAPSPAMTTEFLAMELLSFAP